MCKRENNAAFSSPENLQHLIFSSSCTVDAGNVKHHAVCPTCPWDGATRRAPAEALLLLLTCSDLAVTAAPCRAARLSHPGGTLPGGPQKLNGGEKKISLLQTWRRCLCSPCKSLRWWRQRRGEVAAMRLQEYREAAGNIAAQSLLYIGMMLLWVS